MVSWKEKRWEVKRLVERGEKERERGGGGGREREGGEGARERGRRQAIHRKFDKEVDTRFM